MTSSTPKCFIQFDPPSVRSIDRSRNGTVVIGFSSDASQITIKLVAYDTKCTSVPPFVSASAEGYADEIEIGVLKSQLSGKDIEKGFRITSSRDFVFNFDRVCVKSFLNQLTHVSYQESELVVLVNGDVRTFFRFNDLVSARLFAIEVRELHSFFYSGFGNMHIDHE